MAGGAAGEGCVEGRQAGRVTRRVETSGIERCGKNTPRAAASRWVGGGSGPCFGIGERGTNGVGSEETTGWASVSTCRDDIAHLGHGGSYCSLPPDEMSDDRPTAAHVHTKGDRRTWNLGWVPYARIFFCSKTTAIWYRYNHGRGQHRSVTISENFQPVACPTCRVDKDDKGTCALKTS